MRFFKDKKMQTAVNSPKNSERSNNGEKVINSSKTISKQLNTSQNKSLITDLSLAEASTGERSTDEIVIDRFLNQL